MDIQKLLWTLEEEEEEEYEGEEIPEENTTNTAFDRSNQDNDADTTKIPQKTSDGCDEQLEDSLDDIMNMEQPEDDISDDEHDGKCEEVSEDLQNSGDAKNVDDEL